MIIGGQESADLDAHLASCPDCRAEEVSLSRIRETLSASTFWEEPSPELAERVVAIGRAAKNVRPPGRRVLAWLPAAVAAAIFITGFALTFGRPDWELDLIPVGEDVEASAVVAGWNEPEGTRLRIEVDGVEPSPPGHYYEIWFTSPSGLHVSGGTFSGDGVVTAVVGARRSDFPRIWITLEPVDEDAGPSSETYFDTR